MSNKKDLSNLDINDILEKYNEVKALINDDSQDFDITAFSKGYNKAYGNYSPYAQNELMKSLNFNPLMPTAEKVDRALSDAKNNEDSLISYGQSFYTSNMVYRRAVDNLANLNNWDLSIQCVNASSEDYQKPSFKSDWNKVGDFLNKFDYRAEFSKAMENMIQNETYFCVFRDDMDSTKYVFQDIPYRYAKISARSTRALSYDLDYSYFMQPQVDIDMFPKIIKKQYSKIMNTGGASQYIPSNNLSGRNGVFSMWHQTSPEDGFWAFKFKADSIAQIPYLAPMFGDIVLVPLMRQLQTNQSMAAAKKIVASRWPLIKESKSTGNTSDMLAVKPTTMGQLMGLVDRALKEVMELVNLPSEGYEKLEFTNTDKEGYEKFQKNIASMIGGGNVLFQTSKNIIFEAQLAHDIDANLVNSVYSQFENFLDYYCNKLTKKFKFSFSFSGVKTSFDKGNKFKKAFDPTAIGVGLVSINKIANALDWNVFELTRDLEMTKGMGFAEKLIPLISMYTQSSSSNGAGAPQKDSNELSDSSESTRSNGNNVDRSNGTI